MRLLRLLTSRTARNAWREERFLSAPAQAIELRGASVDRALIATVAFNRPDVIEWQVHLVRRHLAESDGYVVFDNSSREDSRTAIRELCRREAVPYVGLPPNCEQNSYSHGWALNWIVRNYVQSFRPLLFGFLDHDIFPVEPVSIAARISGKVVYGVQSSDGQGRWWLWAGFCFFTNGVPVEELDFKPFPSLRMDTGGGNWPGVFRLLEPDQVRVADLKFIQVLPGTHIHESSFQKIDGWVHAMNASGWNPVGGERGAKLADILTSAAGPAAPTASIERL